MSLPQKSLACFSDEEIKAEITRRGWGRPFLAIRDGSVGIGDYVGLVIIASSYEKAQEVLDTSGGCVWMPDRSWLEHGMGQVAWNLIEEDMTKRQGYVLLRARECDPKEWSYEANSCYFQTD